MGKSRLPCEDAKITAHALGWVRKKDGVGMVVCGAGTRTAAAAADLSLRLRENNKFGVWL